MTKHSTEELVIALAIAQEHGLEAANDLLGGFGVESVCFGPTGKVLEYVNLGETYLDTVALSVPESGNRWTTAIAHGPAGTECEFLITSWGNWYEAAEVAYTEETGNVCCGYCGEYTPIVNNDWHSTICEVCGNCVSG